MTNIVKVYRSPTAGAAPANNAREFGEIAVNTADKKLWVYDENKVPIQFIGPTAVSILKHDGSTTVQVPTESI